ncbi:MAG: SUMF1/EgtB/PvdO family nonheme iron enzyme [Anaerolineae bacterium]|nr:SUMF1/EgtB/PvdO family nonheme iron enzyme [Anaerolineae bacterium]
MARIFISYRRADSQAWADRIYPVLVQAFGETNVFKDVDSIGLSRNFRAAIERAVINTDVVLVLIGRQWVTITDDQGQRRLDSPDDFVRLEAEMSLRHEKMVIPVIVDGARMPASTDLPPTLAELPMLNGAAVRGDPDFDHDMRRLIRAIQEELDQQPSIPRSEAVVQSRIGEAAAAMEAEDYEGAVAILQAEQARNPAGRLARIVADMLADAEAELTRQRYAAEAEREYRPIAQLIQHNRTRGQGCAELADFQRTYPDYDPDGLTQRCADYAAEQRRAAQEAERLRQAAIQPPARIPTAAQPASPVETGNISSANRSIRRLLPGITVLVVVLGAVVALLASRGGGSNPTPTPPPTDTPAQQSAADGRTPVTRNAAWTPVERDFDGVTMVLVPAGCFIMGSTDGDSDEQPVEQQCLDTPFWIDKFEVTNAQYGSTGCEQYSSAPDQPRNCVSWVDASAFCEARGARLPTEAEWEYAARGPDGLRYPWGDTYDAARVIGADDPTYGNRTTAPVGSRPGGASWVGALDMSGNLWEWVSTLYRAYPYRADDGREDGTNRTDLRVLRGGSFGNATGNLRAANRGRLGPDLVNGNLGVRCARSS